MELEERIRTRIEAILVNDARNFSEIKMMAESGEPLETDILDDERNLYHRIINSYRTAVGEVNKLLEESIGSLSAFYQIVENIKEKEDFQEICTQIVNSILQDYGVDYCSLLFPEQGNSLCMEGICEERKFLRIHSRESFLGSKEFEQELTRMAEENAGCLNIEDVYREPRFNAIDFPGVVRSILCLPILLYNNAAGFLILSHSLPNFFHENHVRVLKILSSMIAHLKFLHQSGSIPRLAPASPSPIQEGAERPDSYAIVLMDFDTLDVYGRRVPLDKESIREIRVRVKNILGEQESVLFYGEKELFVFMPGASSESMASRVCRLRDSFQRWREEQFEKRKDACLSLGFAVCEGEEDLARTLEAAALVMHPEADEEDGTVAAE